MTGVDLAALRALATRIGELTEYDGQLYEERAENEVIAAALSFAAAIPALVEAVEAALTHRHRADGRHGAIHEYGADWSIGCSLCAALAPFRQEPDGRP